MPSKLRPPKRGDGYGRYGNGYGYGGDGYGRGRGSGYGYGVGYGYGNGNGYGDGDGTPLTNALATTYACDDNHGALDAVVQRLTLRGA